MFFCGRKRQKAASGVCKSRSSKLLKQFFCYLKKSDFLRRCYWPVSLPCADNIPFLQFFAKRYLLFVNNISCNQLIIYHVTLELGGSQGMRRNFSHSSCPFATLVISTKYLSGKSDSWWLKIKTNKLKLQNVDKLNQFQIIMKTSSRSEVFNFPSIGVIKLYWYL